MLAALIGAQLGAGLFLRGAVDLKIQAAVQLILVGGGVVWLLLRVARGRIPVPPIPIAAWTACLWALSLISALRSARPDAAPAWAAAATGLWLLPTATMLSPRERSVIEHGLRAAAWLLVLWAFYQRIHGNFSPDASLGDRHAFAAAILLLLPFAARARDWALCALLVLCLWETKSVGAWIGLSGAVLLHRRLVGAFWHRAAAGICFISLLYGYAHLQSPSVTSLWASWADGWQMTLSSPWLGRGTGAGDGVRQFILAAAVDNGWIYAALWVFGLAALLRRADSAKRMGPIAVLIFALTDHALSIPGIFWLFCFSAAWVQLESEEAVPLERRQRLPVACALILIAVLVGRWTWLNLNMVHA